MRIHIPALVHRDVINDWEPCAYTGKILRLCRMLTDQGHEVVLYSGEKTDAPVAELVPVVTDADRAGWFGDTDWNEVVFNTFDPMHPAWHTMNMRVVVAMAERLQSHDIIGLTMGTAQTPIQQAFPNHVVAEVGCGYEGVIAGTHRCYESQAWMHYIWGRDRIADGRWFDTVVPNSFDPDDLEFRADHDGYFLFMGRLTPRKGLEVVAEVAKRHWVVTAGQGDERVPGAEHVGVVRGTEKAALLAGARALLAPTNYVEPFGGVAVEAMLSGTPVFASPFGAFTETVNHGVSGFLCHTLGEFLDAADRADRLDPKDVRAWAMARYTLEVCAPQYDAWLRRLQDLYSEGWYSRV